MTVTMDATIARDALAFAIERLKQTRDVCARSFGSGASWAEGEIRVMQAALDDVNAQVAHAAGATPGGV